MASVRDAMLRSYLEGVTQDVADAVITAASDVEHLIALLDNETFPRPDNVVTFLGFKSNMSAVPVARLKQFLLRQAGAPAHKALQRALDLTPRALGWLARRGNEDALTWLLNLSAPANGSDYAPDLSALQLPAAYRERVALSAVWALALCGRPAALDRLQQLRSNATASPLKVRSLLGVAYNAYQLYHGLLNGSVPINASSHRPRRNDGASPIGRRAADTTTSAHALDIDHCNHVDAEAVSSTLATTLMNISSSRVSASDFTGDVACCVTLRSLGNKGTFGVSKDGLNVIESGHKKRSNFLHLVPDRYQASTPRA